MERGCRFALTPWPRLAFVNFQFVGNGDGEVIAELSFLEVTRSQVEKSQLKNSARCPQTGFWEITNSGP